MSIESNGGAATTTTRQAAITGALSFSVPDSLEFIDTRPPKTVFGENVFSKAVMKKRLPKAIFKSLMQTIDAGEKLDATVADVRRVGDEGLGGREGRHALHARVLPADRRHG